MEPRLRLLGSPQLESGGAVLELPVDKPASLVYYLAMRNDWVARSELAYLYRPDAPEEVALGNVRVLLHRAKSTVPGLAIDIEKSRVRCLVHTDVAAFERLIEDGETARSLELYRGPFLSGVNVAGSPGFETWLELERAASGRRWRSATMHECNKLHELGEHEAAAPLLTKLLAADPFDEEALQTYLRVLFAAGRRAEAREAFASFNRVLASELGAEPLESTKELLAGLDIDGATPSQRSLPAEHNAPRHNLPAPTSRFVGRQAEIRDVGAMLDRGDVRLITLTGLGGVGKSRLALEVAARRRPHYADGVWFVELAGTNAPELIASVIATVLRLDVTAQGAPGTLVDYLREKRMLLVLDNFEHLTTGAPSLATMLEAAAGLDLLVTSRTALSVRAESIVELDGLDVPPPGSSEDLAAFDAVRLFVDRAERLTSGFVASGRTLEAVAELARRVEGLPLALELAATWTRSMTTPELLTALEDGLDLLSGSLRDLPERQRSMRTVLDHSFGLLSAGEQRALSRLSVFLGGFTPQAAQRVAGVHLAMLLGLTSHSLIRRSHAGRFHMHELVRRYAEDATPSDPNNFELHQSHSDYFLSFVADRGALLRTPSRAVVLDELFEDIDNIRLAFTAASGSSDERLLAPALPALFELYLEAGAVDEFAAGLEGLAADVTRQEATGGRLWQVVTQQLGRSRMSQGDFRAARTELERLLEQMRADTEDQHTNDLARVLDWLGSSARILGDFEAAERYVGEALDAARATRDEGLRADVTYNLASLRQAQGRAEEALHLFEESLALSLEAGNEVRAAVRRLAIARVLITAGDDLAGARLHLEAALTVGREAHVARIEGGALNALAVLAGQQGDKVGSERFNLESLALARRQGQRDDQRAALANLGGILNDQGRLDEAAVYLRRALELALQSRSPGGLNQVYALLGENSSLRGDHAGAAAYFRSALETTLSRGLAPTALTQCLALLAKTLERSGKVERARDLRLRLLALPTTPPPVRRRIEAALGFTGAAPAPATTNESSAAPPLLTLTELAHAQREALLEPLSPGSGGA